VTICAVPLWCDPAVDLAAGNRTLWFNERNTVELCVRILLKCSAQRGLSNRRVAASKLGDALTEMFFTDTCLMHKDRGPNTVPKCHHGKRKCGGSYNWRRKFKKLVFKERELCKKISVEFDFASHSAAWKYCRRNNLVVGCVNSKSSALRTVLSINRTSSRVYVLSVM